MIIRVMTIILMILIMIIITITCPRILSIFELLLKSIVLFALLRAALAHLVLLLVVADMRMVMIQIMIDCHDPNNDGHDLNHDAHDQIMVIIMIMAKNKLLLIITFSPLSASMLVLARLVTDTARRSSYLELL